MKWLTGLILLTIVATSSAQDPKEASTERGDKMLWSYFEDQVSKIEKSELADIKTKEQWEKKRPELRRQFFEMMGLWPLPKKSDLKVKITGKAETEHFTVENLHYQSIPGLYVTGNLYIPKKLKKKAPAILYVCGHGSTRIDNVSYGNKVTYQHHPAWFAENGYVCLIVDTLQLGEIAGIHHGTYRHDMWWWQCRGYTSAGIECWNAIRALDYLQSRKEVDPERIGVTGRSGGGATSWWTAAADDRVKCIIPVAGIADLRSHVLEGETERLKRGVIRGHCDCMYFVNTYRWDFSTVIALCAPRPLMLGNSDKDSIFPVPGYRRIAKKARSIYKLYDAEDKFVLLETKGPHKDTPELRQGAFQWMNRWLKNDTSEVKQPERPRLTPQQLKVFDRLPKDAINATVQETFVKPAKPKLPANKAEWKEQRKEWMQVLREKVFRGWPENPPKLNVKQQTEIGYITRRTRIVHFTSESKVRLELGISTPLKGKSKEVILRIEDDKERRTGLEDQQLILDQQKAVVELAPRGFGSSRWASKDKNGQSIDQHIKRRFALLGQTVDGQRVWDVRRAVQCIQSMPEFKDVPICLEGDGVMAGIALYASLFEQGVKRLILRNPPASHHEGPIFLNVRRFFDMPQALALASDKQIILQLKDEKQKQHWHWPLELQKRLGTDNLNVGHFRRK